MTENTSKKHEVVVGEFVLDIERGTLTREGDVVPVRAKAYALLSHLVANRGRVVSKDELFEVLWPDVTVSEDSLTQCVKDLRKVLGDESQSIVQTVPRRGYLLAGAKTVHKRPTSQDKAIPSVAVLRFRDETGDPQDRALVDGIAEEITLGLSRFQLVTVIARNSAFSFPLTDRPTSKQIGEKLGADYLVEGWASRIRNRLKIAVSLVTAPTGRAIWSEHFDHAEDDIAALNDAIAYKIISRLVSTIEDVVSHRAAAAATENVKAFESLVSGIITLRSSGQDANTRGRESIARAVLADPSYGLAHAYLALADVMVAGYGAAPIEILERARDRLTHALELAPNEPRVHRIMAMIRMFLGERPMAERFLRRSLDLNPYDADTLAQLGFLRVIRGYPEEGLEWIDKAILLNPFHPDWYHFDRALALFQLGRFEEAAQAQENVPSNGYIYEVRLAATYAMIGSDDLVSRHRDRAVKIAPERDPVEFVRRALPFEKPGDQTHMLDAVRLAFGVA